ncbi:MAG: DUF3310 domain-containing protein [Clostridia bacterium]|nr:DUF3310 domain-containing protein [Clostridia bacterium]
MPYHDPLKNEPYYDPLKDEPLLSPEPIVPPEHDPVNHPSHYCDGGIETIDFIEAKKLPYHLGNAVKYISRAGKKNDALEDLKKARWYLDRYIALQEKEVHLWSTSQ